MECAGELDWVAKLELLTRYRDRDDLDWDDAKLHLIDLQYSRHPAQPRGVPGAGS